MKNIKYLAQLAPAVAMTVLAAFGFQQSAPIMDAVGLSTTAQAADVEELSAEQEEAAEQAVGDYTDGTYTGTGIGYRGEVTVQVEVEEKQIAEVSVLSHSDDESFFNRAKTLIDSILQQQTWEVDSVSGATYSSRGIKEAVENALTGKESTSSAAASGTGSSSTVQTEQSLETPAGGYADGTYTGSAQGFGGTITVNVTVKDGKISAIDIVSAAGETPSYFANAKKIIDSMLSSNSPNVDTVSGATISSTGIKNAVINALKQASGSTNTSTNASSNTTNTKQTGSTDKKLSGTYINGTYTGTGTGWGGEIKVQLTIQSNRITKLDVVSAKNETKSFLDKAKSILDTILTKQTADVDAVSGATFSSNGIKEAVANALEKAKATAKTQTITTGQDSYTVTEGDAPFSLQAKAKTALSYASSDKKVVTVSSKGQVTAVGPGSATVTISAAKTSAYKAAAKKVKITVLSADSDVQIVTGTSVCVPDDSNQFEEYTLSMDVTFVDGKATAIAAPVMTPNVTTNVSYLNSAFNGLKDQLLSTQDADKVDAVSGATCSSIAIQNAFRDAVGQQKSEPKNQIITTDESSYRVQLGDEAFSLNAKANGELSYASDDETVVTVDETGLVTVVGKGTAVITITASATDEYKEATKKLSITVTGKTQTITTEDTYSLNLGDDPMALNASTDAEGMTLTYRSDDEDIATVSKDGKVTPVAAGTVKIEISAEGNDTYEPASKTVVVTVIDPNGETEPQRSGTYTGTAVCNPDDATKNFYDFGEYTVSITVTFEHGVVTSISDPEFYDEYGDNEWYMNKAAKTILPGLKTEGTADAVSGATCSSKALIAAYQDACAQADAALGG
ncbi:MAG: FMN-binding protein [Butyricicoccus sp.]